jgi:hypothetical protein
MWTGFVWLKKRTEVAVSVWSTGIWCFVNDKSFFDHLMKKASAPKNYCLKVFKYLKFLLLKCCLSFKQISKIKVTEYSVYFLEKSLIYVLIYLFSGPMNLQFIHRTSVANTTNTLAD